MKRSEIAAARLKVALAKRSNQPVAPEIAKLAATPLSAASTPVPEPTSDEVVIVEPESSSQRRAKKVAGKATGRYVDPRGRSRFGFKENVRWESSYVKKVGELVTVGELVMKGDALVDDSPPSDEALQGVFVLFDADKGLFTIEGVGRV